MSEQAEHNFLVSFFAIFNATLNECKKIGQKITGDIKYNDSGSEDEKQEFVWYVEDKKEELADLKSLCDFLWETKLIDGDNITLNEKDLIAKLAELNWDAERAQKAIDSLCDIEIKMVDDGEETDFFFLHF